MKIQLPQKFRMADSRRVVSPLVDQEWEFELWRPDACAPYREHVEARAKESRVGELTKPLLKLAAKSGLAAQMQVGKREGKERKKLVAEMSAELFREQLAEVDLPDDALESLFESISGPEAAALLTKAIHGVRDEDGTEIEATDADMIREVLSLALPLPFDYEDGDLFIEEGTPVGRALSQWVVFEAGRTQAFHVSALEGAAKN